MRRLEVFDPEQAELEVSFILTSSPAPLVCAHSHRWLEKSRLEEIAVQSELQGEGGR